MPHAVIYMYSIVVSGRKVLRKYLVVSRICCKTEVNSTVEIVITNCVCLLVAGTAEGVAQTVQVRDSIFT